MPRNGPYVLGGMANHGGAAAEKIRALGVSRQAASQLVDTLVERNYLRRDTDDADRRRVALELTDRGQAAATAVRPASSRWTRSRPAAPHLRSSLPCGPDLSHSSTSERNARTPRADAD
jgi:DNA-binding IclR family transcriptional regulator